MTDGPNHPHIAVKPKFQPKPRRHVARPAAAKPKIVRRALQSKKQP